MRPTPPGPRHSRPSASSTGRYGFALPRSARCTGPWPSHGHRRLEDLGTGGLVTRKWRLDYLLAPSSQTPVRNASISAVFAQSLARPSRRPVDARRSVRSSNASVQLREFGFTTHQTSRQSPGVRCQVRDRLWLCFVQTGQLRTDY